MSVLEKVIKDVDIKNYYQSILSSKIDINVFEGVKKDEIGISFILDPLKLIDLSFENTRKVIFSNLPFGKISVSMFVSAEYLMEEICG